MITYRFEVRLEGWPLLRVVTTNRTAVCDEFWKKDSSSHRRKLLSESFMSSRFDLLVISDGNTDVGNPLMMVISMLVIHL